MWFSRSSRVVFICFYIILFILTVLSIIPVELIEFGFIVLVCYIVFEWNNRDNIFKSYDDSELANKNFARAKDLDVRLEGDVVKKDLKREIRDETIRKRKKEEASPRKQKSSSSIIQQMELTRVNWDEYNEELDKAIEYLNHKAKNPENIAWGVKQISRLAEMGMPRAQYKLSLLHYTGEGVEEDINKYFYWMGKCESVYGSATNPKFMERIK